METTTYRSVPFQFLGSAAEYFRIWVVNILLTVLTLGLYGPWAKVRNRRYFYGNIRLLDAPFDYLADPVAILKGRLLVLAVFGLYLLAVVLAPAVEPVLIIAFLALLPWIVIKAVAFNLRNTAYRNIRFRFNGQYGRALWIFLGLPLVTALSLGLAYPWFVRERKRFLLENSSFGTTPFDPQAPVGGFYLIYAKALGTLVAAGIVAGLALSLSGLQLSDEQALLQQQLATMSLLFMPGVFALYLFLYGYVYAATTNYMLNHTRLEGHRLQSTMKAVEIFWLYLTNTLAIIFSLGLLIPWAKVRMVRYRTSHLALVPVGSFDTFVAAEDEKVRAIGEEAGEFFDIDIGL